MHLPLNLADAYRQAILDENQRRQRAHKDAPTSEYRVTQADVVKCMAYDDPAFDPPCPIDHAFAVWAGVFWRLQLSNERIAELRTLYLDTPEPQRDELFRQMRDVFLNVAQDRQVG